uniref:cysteine--tRNA ligase n=1 Tax=Alexandrium monilatum TaxID=311494 RepID=A0A7S4T7M1_9DINO
MEVAHLRRLGLAVAPEGSPPVVLRRGSAPAPRAAAAVPPPAPPAGAARQAAPRPGAGGHGPCCLLGCGFAPEAVERQGRAPWLKPQGGFDVGLQAVNSLTNEKEPFVPLDGKKIRWYTCGPTVYDSAHMGHARTFLSFDILRRVMSNYFGYEVSYQINITDIDDKIILRSRQKKLLADFCKEAEGQDLAAVKAAVDSAVDFAGKKLLAKAPKEPEAPPQGAPDKAKQEYEKSRLEYETLKQEHGLKLAQHEELKLKVTQAADSKAALLEAARDPLMAKLDKERGHTVTDHSIFDAHARHFEDEYFEDMDALGILRPDVTTRISTYMDGRVQKFIERLEDMGFAYESNGSVYFSIDDFNKQGYNYRKLVPATSTSEAEMAEGEGALAAEDAEKRNKNDFAVWKKSKPGEPAWESRWGPGRPGWHIECSVMATDIHREFLDIHAGGEDLRFPHHDNEMAQSEAYLGRPQWVNYFWHAGHLSIAGLKMSKSLKNFITIRQALQVHTSRQLRLMFLMQQWDKSMNYSDQAIEMAKAEERKLKHFFGRLKFHLRGQHSKGSPGDREKALAEALKACEDAVGASLRDNFTTAKVVESLSRLVSECLPFFDALPDAALEPVSKAAAFVERIFGILGVEGLDPKVDNEAAWIPALDAFAGLRQDVRQLARAKALDVAAINGAVERSAPAAELAAKAGLEACAAAFGTFRTDILAMVKEGKPAGELLRRCDEVRDKDFVALGVRLEDRGDGFLWMFDDPEALRRELREQAEKAAAAARDKIANRLALKRQELQAAEKAAVQPALLFREGPDAATYGAFDESGLPTKLAGGEEVSKSLSKQLAKQLAKQQKDFEKLQKQAGEGGVDAFLEKLRKEVGELEAQVRGQQA